MEPLGYNKHQKMEQGPLYFVSNVECMREAVRIQQEYNMSDTMKISLLKIETALKQLILHPYAQDGSFVSVVIDKVDSAFVCSYLIARGYITKIRFVLQSPFLGKNEK